MKFELFCISHLAAVRSWHIPDLLPNASEGRLELKT